MKHLLTLAAAALLLATPPAVMAQLDSAEADTLVWMREEEKLARDVYLTLYDDWQLGIFANIANSEQRHTDAVLAQILYFGLEDPVKDDTVGVFTNSTLAALYTDLVTRGEASLLEALHVGAYIEEIDIADLWNAIDQTDEPGLLFTYENLLAGSRNHLRAFVGQIESRGVTYEAQALTQEEVDAIVGGYELPETEFTINSGLNDAWYYPATSGQGFFITVYPDSQTLFLSWFTFDTALPADDAASELGWPGQRWLTAQGRYEGATADLQVYSTSGGLFDDEESTPSNVPSGSILLQFDGCNAGSVSYDLPSIGLNGVIPIERIAPDNVPHCENLASNAAD